jgi:tetratricopeptide (TPR) repeat protein
MRAVLLGLIVALAMPATLALPGTADSTPAPRVEWKRLVGQYKQVLLHYPTDVYTRYNLAMVYAHEGQVMDGYRELQAVDRQLAGKRDDFTAQVVAESQRILARTPGHVPTRYRLAFALWFQGRKEETRAEFDRIVALEPDHSWSLAYLGYTHADAGDLDTAVALWERGVQADPTNSVLHYVLGLAYTRKGQLKKAAAHFTAAYRDRTLYEYVKQQENK